jgi:hypothetical protein
MKLREENLRLKLALASMVQQFYDWRIKPEEASNYNIDYDPDDEYVNCYFHMFESAGERAWNMLGLKEPIVSETTMWDLTEKLRDELLELLRKQQ